jgi:hypothetical protein
MTKFTFKMSYKSNYAINKQSVLDLNESSE